MMWPQVNVAVGGQTNQAGFESLTLHPMAEVTGHLSRHGRGTTVVRRVSDFCVDLQLWSFVEILIALWTLADATEGRVVCDAALAVDVSAGSGDRFGEHFQTD